MNVPTYRARSMKVVKEEKKRKTIVFRFREFSLRDCVTNQKRQRESLGFVLICI